MVSRVRVKLAVLELPFRVAVTTAVCAAEMVPAVSATEAVVAPAATVSEAGDAKRVLLLLRLTAVPPVGADCEMATVHVVVAPEPSDVGLQVRKDNVGGGFSVKLAVLELPFRVAVKTAVCAVGTVPAVSLADAVVAPAAMVTDTGVAKKLLLLLKATTVPPVGAAGEMTTLHVVAPPELSVVGVHANEDRVGVPVAAIPRLPGVNVKLLVAELPFRLAVNTAVCAVAMVPAVSLTDAAVAPAGTVREAGELRSELFVLRATTAPPTGAACASEMLQVLAPTELSAVGTHLSEASVGRTDMVPPLAETFTELAGADAARTPERAILVLTAWAESVNRTVATNPFAITLSFGPLATQVYVPGPAAQVMLLEAAVRAGAAVIVTLVMIAVGYASLHCRPATWLFPASLKVRPIATVPPATPVPDASDRVVCAQHVLPARTSRSQANFRAVGSKALNWCSIR